MNQKYLNILKKNFNFIIDIDTSPSMEGICLNSSSILIKIDGSKLSNHINNKNKTTIPIFYGLTYHIINYFDISSMDNKQYEIISNIESLLNICLNPNKDTYIQYQFL